MTKAKATEVFDKLTQQEFRHCFAQWKIRMERCRDPQGKYVGRDKVSSVIDDE